MALAVLTSKGQMTIPKAVRNALKLTAGDKIEIIVTDNGEAIMRPVSKKVDEIFCKLHDPKREPVSTEAMHQAVKDRIRARYNK